MEKDNNHHSEKIYNYTSQELENGQAIANALGYNVETLIKTQKEQWSDNGSDECTYEEESYGSNNETYEEIHSTDPDGTYSAIYHQEGSNGSDVTGLMPVSTVYSVTDYPTTGSGDSNAYLSTNQHHPVVTTISPEDLNAGQTVQVQFEPDYSQEVLGHQNIVSLAGGRNRENLHQNESDPHEKHIENDEINSTPSAHPDLISLQQLANTADPQVQNGIRVQLQGKDLWRTFYEIGTEMIITKKVGRRMFPAIRIKVSGLKPQRKYVMMLDIEAVDDNRYRYVYHSSKWMVAGTADNPVPPRVYVHPESPATGEAWMRQIVSFDKLKLTNHENDNQGHMILHSMHKYQPRVHVLEVLDEHNPPPTSSTQKVDMNAPGLTTFIFRETQFITVTAYQNQQITRLKIDRNPFAKGFRNSGRNKPTQYDQNGPPMPGTYAAWRSSHLAASAAAANQTSKSQSTDFTQVSPMATQVGWSTNQGQHGHHYSPHHSAIHQHQKFSSQTAYPSIQNLSPSILTHSDADRFQIYHSGYGGYIPQSSIQGDQKLEVTVLSTQLNNSLANQHIHVARPPTGSKRSITSLSSAGVPVEHYPKARYEDEYQSDSPNMTDQHVEPIYHHHQYL